MTRARDLILLLAAGTAAWAQKPEPAATLISDSVIQDVLKKTAQAQVSDTALQVAGIKGEYNVEIAIVHRANTHGQATGGAIEHDDLTEVYHVISGTGTLVTGGKISGAKRLDPEGQTVKLLAGPGSSGNAITGGVSRKIGPGDVIVIPPDVAHWFSEISPTEIVYLVVRIDPHKVLPAGYSIKP